MYFSQILCRSLVFLQKQELQQQRTIKGTVLKSRKILYTWYRKKEKIKGRKSCFGPCVDYLSFKTPFHYHLGHNITNDVKSPDSDTVGEINIWETVDILSLTVRSL